MRFPPDLVIFDCDGVLVDSEPITNALIAGDLATHGLVLTPEEVMDRFIGGTLRDVETRVRDGGTDLPMGWSDGIYSRMFDKLREGTPAIPGIHDVLDRLAANGIPASVASNGPQKKMAITLGQNGLADRFDGHILSAHDVGLENAKPNPGLFEEAARRRGVAAERVVVIEDSATGARAAAAAGMICFGYAAHTQAEKLVAEGAIPFTDMKDLPGLLGLAG